MIALHEGATQLQVAGEERELDLLVSALAFRPNGYYFAPSFERFRLTDGQQGWDGWIRPLRKSSAVTGQCLRGYKSKILGLCEAHDIEVDDRKCLTSPFVTLTMADIPPNLITAPFELDEGQRRGILLWLHEAIAINQVTVSGGKTAMFAGAAAIIKKSYPDTCFLYVTPAERLVHQVTVEMKKFLPGWEVGQYGGGKHQKDAKDMVVCTVAILYRNLKELFTTGWLRRFKALLYDEVHHCGSPSSEKVLLRIPAYFRLGASDSSKEGDPARQSKMEGLFGPIVSQIRAAPLIRQGRIAKPHIYIEDLKPYRNKFKGTPYSPKVGSIAHVLVGTTWEQGKYLGPVLKKDADGNVEMRVTKVPVERENGTVEMVDEETPVIEPGLHRISIEGEELEIESRWCLLNRVYDRAIVQFEERNQLIVDWTKRFVQRDLPTVVVCTRTTHIYALEAALQKVLPLEQVRILFGWSSPKERNETFDWFRATDRAVLVTPLVKEGVSINEIRAGVVADYVADPEVARQILGRFIRKKAKDNFAEVVWFREHQHPTLRRGSNSVIRALAEFEEAVVYDDAMQLRLPVA